MDREVNNFNSAVILGLGITGLGVIRNLGRNGIRIIGVDSDQFAISLFSRYCSQRMIYRQTTLNERFKDYLIAIGEGQNLKSVLIPCEDKYVRFISEYQEELEKYFIFVILDKQLCENIINKRLFYHLALKHNLHMPKTFFPQFENKDIASIASQIKYPCIIKPVYSQKWNFASTVKVIKINTPDNLIKRYQEILSYNDTELLIQEIIPGSDREQYSVCAYFNRDSKPLATFVARKIRQDPIGFGVGTFVKSVEEPKVEKTGIDFLKKIKYKGIVEVEFKKDSHDDKFKLIEINARSWTQNTLPTKCGINIIYLSYLDAIGKSNVLNYTYRAEVKWFNIFRDLISSAQYIKTREISLKEWIRSFKGVEDFAVFSWDDSLPFLYFPIYTVLRLSSEIKFKFKKTKLFRLVHWGYFFIKHEGFLFFVRLLLRRIIRYEHFLIMQRALHENLSPANSDHHINVNMASKEDIKGLQLNTKLYAFENYRNRFSKVKTCFFAYYKKSFAGISWVYFKEEGYKYYNLDSKEAAIGPVYIRKEYRGRGVATKLVNDICFYLKNKNYNRAIGIMSKKNFPSIRMFEKTGFKNVDKFRYLKFLGFKILPRGLLR